LAVELAVEEETMKYKAENGLLYDTGEYKRIGSTLETSCTKSMLVLTGIPLGCRMSTYILNNLFRCFDRINMSIYRCIKYSD
jgi:hypothetical protein